MMKYEELMWLSKESLIGKKQTYKGFLTGLPLWLFCLEHLFIVLFGAFFNKVKEGISSFQIIFNYEHYMNYLNTERQIFLKKH